MLSKRVLSVYLPILLLIISIIRFILEADYSHFILILGMVSVSCGIILARSAMHSIQEGNDLDGLHQESICRPASIQLARTNAHQSASTANPSY